MEALIDFEGPAAGIPAKKWLLKYGRAQRVRIKTYMLVTCLSDARCMFRSWHISLAIASFRHIFWSGKKRLYFINYISFFLVVVLDDKI